MTEQRPATRYGRDIPATRRAPYAAARELLRASAIALVAVAAVTADNASDPRWLIALFVAFMGWVAAYTAIAVALRVR